MQRINRFLVALVLGLTATTASAAIGTDAAPLGDPHVAAADSGARSGAADTERLRRAGEDACREAVNTAAVLGDAFRQISSEVLPLLLETGATLARRMEPTLREMEPSMRRFGDRLRGILRQMEQPVRERRVD